MGRVRQADIARVAGVSQATVSVVLGGNRAGVRLSERTRLRVLETAERLGYATSSTDLFGVYPAVGGPILAGIQAEAAALGKDLVVFTAPERIRRTRPVDGCLFLGRDVPAEVLADGLPVVRVGREVGGIPHVGVDYASASAEVVTRLARAGHRHIRYVRPVDQPTVGSWLADGVTALVVDESDFDPTWRALRAAGISVPGDVSLAVFGVPPTAEVAISGFEVPWRELGRTAVRTLVSLIRGEDPSSCLLVCPPVAGETIGPVG